MELGFSKSWIDCLELSLKNGTYCEPGSFQTHLSAYKDKAYSFKENVREPWEAKINAAVIKDIAEAYNLFLDYSKRDEKSKVRVSALSENYLRFVNEKTFSSFVLGEKLHSMQCSRLYMNNRYKGGFYRKVRACIKALDVQSRTAYLPTRKEMKKTNTSLYRAIEKHGEDANNYSFKGLEFWYKSWKGLLQ